MGRFWARGDNHGAGVRCRAANDAAGHAANCRANGPADDGACNGSAGRAGKGAVAVSDSQGRKRRERQG